MAEILYTGLVPAADMERIVEVCQFTPEACFLAELIPIWQVKTQREREDLLQFTFFKRTLRCTDYTSGRIFQHDRELRWERQGERMRVIYLGSAENEAQLAACQLQKKETLHGLTKKAEPTYYALFGERLRDNDLLKLGKAAQKGDFAVVRIPRMLRYPVKVNDDRYARLLVCEYVETGTQRVVLFRFQGVESWRMSDESV
jgi:hypothetical protein